MNNLLEPKIRSLLLAAQKKLEHLSSTPNLDAEILLAKVLQVERTYLFTHPEQTLTSAQSQAFSNFLSRRIAGEPVAYITGHQGFWTLDLQVTKDTLIPRPETELLVEVALQLLPANPKIKIVDLGTGSGAIALALASERPQWDIYAIDNSIAALKIASQNARDLNLKHIKFYQGKWCLALPERDFNAIISNPPYIANHDPHLLQSGLPFEPRQALVADENGLQALREIIEQAITYLVPGGWIILEHGFEQMKAVQKLFYLNGFCDVKSERDLNRHWRVSIARKPEKA